MTNLSEMNLITDDTLCDEVFPGPLPITWYIEIGGPSMLGTVESSTFSYNVSNGIAKVEKNYHFTVKRSSAVTPMGAHFKAVASISKIRIVAPRMMASKTFKDIADRLVTLNSPALTARELLVVEKRKADFRTDSTALKTFKISSATVTFNMSKHILAGASPVFARMFENGKFQENIDNAFEIADHSAPAVEQFLLFVYNGFAPEMAEHVLELIKMGHMYEIPNLVTSCQPYLVKEVASSVNPEQLEKYVQIATLLDLEIILAVIHLIHLELYPRWSTAERLKWIEVTAKAPGFLDATMKALAVSTSSVCHYS